MNKCIDLDWFFCSMAVIDSLIVTAPIVLCVFCDLYLFCCAVLSVLTGFAIISPGKRELVALLYCLLMSCNCYCSMSFPHGGVGLSAVSDCGISWSYLLYL